MTLMELVVNELVWNKEKIQVEIDNEFSKVDRIEFLMYDYEDYKIDWFESGEGVYLGEKRPIILFHLSKESE